MDSLTHSFESHLERGDHNAAAEWLVRTHGRDVLNLCAAMVRDRGTAEDLAQDAFSKAFTALPDLRGDASARTWLMTIARHRCLDHLRRSARQPWSLGRDEDLREPAEAAPDDALVSDLLARQADLRVGLEALTEGERAMVMLRFAHGLSFEEIADSFGLKSGAVRMRVGRSLSKMRDAIEGGAGEVVCDLVENELRAGAVPADLGPPLAGAAPAPAPERARTWSLPRFLRRGDKRAKPGVAPGSPPSSPPVGSAPGSSPRDALAVAGSAGSLGAVGSAGRGAPAPAPASAPPAPSPVAPSGFARAASAGAEMTRAGGVTGSGSVVERMLGALLLALDSDTAAEDAFVERMLDGVPGR